MKSLLPMLLFCSMCFSQQALTGKIANRGGKPVSGANVFIKGSYDGGITDDLGRFEFQTSQKGSITLMVTAAGYEDALIPINLAAFQPVALVLRELPNSLDAVIVTAGTLEAGDKARASVLKPLDIVTTAGSAGNIVAALQTLPGTQAAGEDGRLFVRGGHARETHTFIDGIRVAQPYGATLDNLPARGRFSPFLFSGISFSTGGYSAEYGDALSGVLLLNTSNEVQQEKTDISLMTVGLGVGNTQKWQNRSLSFNAAYIDLAPYQLAVPQNVKFNRAFQSLSGEAVYRHEMEKGIFKAYAAFDASRFGINSKNIDMPEPVRIGLQNNNFYLNTGYKGDLAHNWQLFAGAGAGLGNTITRIDDDSALEDDDAIHLKLRINKRFGIVKFATGAEWFRTIYARAFRNGQEHRRAFDANSVAGFTEADFLISRKFAIKAGLRWERHDLLGSPVLSPRVAAALKLHRGGQVSFAAGHFAQSPEKEFLTESTSLTHEYANHLIFNYQYSLQKRLLRFEAYAKDYGNLVRFGPGGEFPANFAQDGGGFARGVEVFWRDSKSFKNVEYWISYSLLDTQRKYRDFPVRATPAFAAAHTLSAVAKIWVNSLSSQIGLTNTFASGRPFENPEKPGFLESRTRGYNNLSLSWAYLLSAQKILYFSASNVLGTDNVFGYQYASVPETDGRFRRQPITQQAGRFFFVGFFWTISSDKKSNQLDNL